MQTALVCRWLFARNQPRRITLVQQTLPELFVTEPIERLIGDNAYDSDRLDKDLAETGVEMIAPRRWKIEGCLPGYRTIAVLQCAGNIGSTISMGCFIWPVP